MIKIIHLYKPLIIYLLFILILNLHNKIEINKMVSAPSFNVTPEPIIHFNSYKVITAFTGASIGNIFLKLNAVSRFDHSGGSLLEPYFSCWLNTNTMQMYTDSQIDVSKLEFIGISDSGGGGSSTTALNTLNSTVSANLSSIINLNNVANTGLSSISSAISSTNSGLTQVNTSIGTVSAGLSSTNSLLTSANTLNTSMNSNLLSISSGIAGLGTGNTTGNTYLSQISNTLGTAFATATLNVDAIPANTTRNYSNVKSAVITAQPVLLATTLNTSSISINGANVSLNSPVTVAIPPNTKLSNTLTISGGNIPVTIVYTT